MSDISRPGGDNDDGDFLVVSVGVDDDGNAIHTESNEDVIDFEAAMKTGRWPFPMALECRICRKPVRMVRHPYFCNTHWRERTERQKTGVSRDELSTQWEDNLSTWMDRPASLRDESAAEEFELSWPIGDWLLFSRSYPMRGADWIVVNTITGEIRRFADVGREEIEEELRGGNPAPRQDEAMKHWGLPEGGLLQQMLAQIPRLKGPAVAGFSLPRLANLVRECGFPVYGLAAETGFTIASFSFGGLPIDQVELTFFKRGDESEHVWVRLESRARRYRAVGQSAEDKDTDLNGAADSILFSLHRDQDLRRFRRVVKEFGLGDSIDPAPAVAGFAQPRARKWNVPEQLNVLRFENDVSIFIVATSSLGDRQLDEVCRSIKILTAGDELLVEYDRLMDEQLAELRRQQSQ